jgi:hypothetical protein
MVQSKRAQCLAHIPMRPTHSFPQNVFRSSPTVLAGHSICFAVAGMVFSTLLSINYTAVDLCMLTEYRVQCYPWIHLITVCLKLLHMYTGQYYTL